MRARPSSEPAWSPNGRQIAFASVRDGDGEIYVMNADGSHRRPLTHNRIRDFTPSWGRTPRPIR